MLESSRRINGINMQTFYRAAESFGLKMARPIYFLTREITLDPYYIDYKDVHEYLNRIVQFNISVRAASWCAWIDNDGYNFPTVRPFQWKTIVVIFVPFFFFLFSFSPESKLFFGQNFTRQNVRSQWYREIFREIVFSIFRTSSRVSSKFIV